MHQTLYRKYRPQTFEDLIGQNHIKITLQNEILSGQIAHAYLFTGPHGIGKTSLARIFAKALNCQNRKSEEFEPCNNCQSCKDIVAGKSLDLIEMDAATHTQVEKVRDNIIENVRFAPHAGKYKIFIIDEVHMLSTAAFNALLKTLEEPPEYVIFILCTTEIYKLPETIISRCQRFDFKKISINQIVGKLKKIIDQEKAKISDEVLQTIAYRSGGFIRDAEGLLGQVITLLSGKDSKNRAEQDKGKEITLKDIEPILPRSDLESISNLVESLISRHARKGIEIINQLISNGVDLERFNLDLIEYLRKMILVKTGVKDENSALVGLPEAIENKLIEQSEKITIGQLTNFLGKFMAAQPAIKEAEISQLPLEIAVIELCEQEKLAPPFPSGTSQCLDKDEDNKNKTQKRKNQSQELKATNNQELTDNTDNTDNNEKEAGNLTAEKARDCEPQACIKLETIKNVWSQIIKECQKANHSLPLILKTGYPYALDNNKLKLGFEFEIHAKKIKEEKTLSLAEKILEKVTGVKLQIKPEVLPREKIQAIKTQQNKQQDNKSDQLNEILNSFGGRIIE